MTKNNQQTSARHSQIQLVPLKTALIAGHPQTVRVLVRVQAPDAVPEPARVRPVYQLALVIDRSGSMAGDPLAEAKRCARFIVDQLKPEDRASVVAFDSQVQVLAPARPVGDRRALYEAIEAIYEGGTTNLHGGWKAGADTLRAQAAERGLSRVILLSDGNANEGLTDLETIVREVGHLAEQGVTTSTYGLGGSFNEDLMLAMTKAGRGNAYYGQTAQDLFEPFAEEFDLIASLYARDLRLTLGVPQGVEARVLNDYPVEADRGFPVVRLPDLAWGAEAWALVELNVPAPQADASAHPLLQVEVCAADLDGRPVVFPEARLKLPALPAQAWEALAEDTLVRQRLHEIQSGQLLEQARAAARQGDWKTIDRLLHTARERYADNPWVLQVLESLGELARQRDQALFSKEALYTSRRMNTRLAAKEEFFSAAGDLNQPAFLRRKSSQGKAQFRKGPGAQPPRPVK